MAGWRFSGTSRRGLGTLDHWGTAQARGVHGPYGVLYTHAWGVVPCSLSSVHAWHKHGHVCSPHSSPVGLPPLDGPHASKLAYLRRGARGANWTTQSIRSERICRGLCPPFPFPSDPLLVFGLCCHSADSLSPAFCAQNFQSPDCTTLRATSSFHTTTMADTPTCRLAEIAAVVSRQSSASSPTIWTASHKDKAQHKDQGTRQGTTGGRSKRDRGSAASGRPGRDTCINTPSSATPPSLQSIE